MSTGGQALPERATTILRGLVGSTVHGVSVEGQDDRDEMGICIEPPAYVIGLKHFETHVWRTQPEGVKSGPGDLDLTIHSLRKFMRLAAKGNPTIITLLYLPDEFVIEHTDWGRRLMDQRAILHCRKAGGAFLGYMTAQRERLEGIRGGRHGWRQHLVDTYGFDTKYAGHLIRLGYQGVEYLESGHITLPMEPEKRDEIVAIRTGHVDVNDVLTRSGLLERRLKDLLDTSPLPDEPDHEAINDFLVEAYQEAWEFMPDEESV